MPDFFSGLDDEMQQRLERLSAKYGYKNAEELANDILKEMLIGKLTIRRPFLMRVKDYFKKLIGGKKP